MFLRARLNRVRHITLDPGMGRASRAFISLLR